MLTALTHWRFALRCGIVSRKGFLQADGPIQMIFFSMFMMWAFPSKEYRVQPGEPHTSIWRPLWDSINLCTSALFIYGCNLVELLSQGTLPSRSGPSCPILQDASPAGAHPRLRSEALGKLSASGGMSLRLASHAAVHTRYQLHA